MINLDPKVQNKVLAAGDWRKKDIGIDPADPAVLTVDPAKFSTSDSIVTNPIRPTEPVTPGDTVDPVPVAVHNSSPETPGDLLSAPNDDNETNSSLSPVPSHPGPPSDGVQSDLAVDKPTSVPTDPPPAETPAAASRQSTPLTELSGPATPSRVKTHDPTPEVGGNEGMSTAEQAEAKKGDQEGDDADGKSDAAGSVTAVAAESTEDKVGEEKRRNSQAQTRSLGKGAAPAAKGSSQPPAALSDFTPAKAPPSASSSRVIPNGVVSDVAQPADTSSSQPPHKGAPRPQKPPPALPAADEKATVILQLNAELLKVCIECQTRQMMQSSEFNSYATRLQSNLTWLAAAADRDRHTSIPLPIMSPPTAVSFFSSQSINEFYQRLPHLFAKEIATRQKEAAQTNSAGVKRGSDTADDAVGMRKRLDTGERRLSNPTSSSSPPHARSPSVMSNGTVGSAAGMNVGMNMGVDPHGQPAAQGMGMVMMTPQQASQQQPALRVSPESVQPSNQQPPFAPGAMSEAQIAQARERARQMQMRQNQAMVPKEAQRMPPPSLPNGLPTTTAQAANHVTASASQGNNTQVMQVILNAFGQPGLQNYHALQQGASHPFVNYMNNNLPGFSQLPLHQQLQKMQIVQNNIQSARAQQAQAQAQAQRAAAAATAASMNGMAPQAVADASSPFGRHSGSPPDVGAPHLQQHQGHPQMSPSHQSANLPYPTMNGMGLSMQPGMQAQRPGASVATNIGAGTAMGGLPPGVSMNSLTPQQRQLFLMQQQMHLRSNDGLLNPQQAYAAAQEKMRLEQQSRMSNHQQQHSPTHPAGSPPNPGSLANHTGMGTAGMPGIARSARSPPDATPATPRVPQKRPGQPSDPYHMAFYHQAQAQRQASMRPGTAMGGMPTQQQQQQQQQQASQYGANGGTANHGMMYGGAAGLNTHSSPQNWQTSTPQQQQQQQFHSVSPAALQHHLDSGTPRPASSASNNAIVANDPMGDSFESLFNWNGT